MPALPLLRAHGALLSGAFGMFLLSSFGQTFFIALSSADLQREFGLSHGELAGLNTATVLAGAFSLSALGHLADRHRLRTLLLWAVPLLAALCALMGLVRQVALLALVLYGLRLLGQGAMTHLAFTAVGRWFDEERGKALSVASLGLNIGQALLPIVYVTVAGWVGWRSAWLWAAGFVLACWPLVCALLRDEGRGAAAGAAAGARVQRQWTRQEVLRDAAFYGVLLAIVPLAFVGNTVFFHQVFLSGLRGWPAEAFALGFAVMSVATVLSAFWAGHLVDRHSAIALLPYYLLPLGAGCLALGVVQGVWVVLPFMLLFGVSNGFSLTLFGAVWPELYGVAHLGAIRSVVVTATIACAAIGPGISGVLLDHGAGFDSLLLAMGAGCLLISLAMLPLCRRLRARRGIAPQADVGGARQVEIL